MVGPPFDSPPGRSGHTLKRTLTRSPAAYPIPWAPAAPTRPPSPPRAPAGRTFPE
ncbi:uncharacterized protein THITE_2084158 [Thermothielavioides terrestris NRRL 8126]|uniref:Uncharacterized protein n=1 Tax=Thermothielavioides terrestris (strain ATCC 38088 / NRRL 8126) TaxID=578455 RepID=G2QSG6_THETT|nr:uncharacterized protein THITE_2084158 [Thermothielavioides terrestris NRRL 8126]AEO62647.1 hypothetical protein THITE_2084158 [Thermothielavioides terrestris NRRL 8126]